MDASATMNAVADISAWSTIKETLTNKLTERNDEIKELRLEILVDRESQHLGCKSEIEDLKSQIATLQKNNIFERVAIVYTPDNTELREKELETETEQFREKLTQVQSEFKYANNRLQ